MGEGRASRDFNFNARILINKQIRQNTQQSLRKAQECEQEIGLEREREREPTLAMTAKKYATIYKNVSTLGWGEGGST